jgi:hypothetical protein
MTEELTPDRLLRIEEYLGRKLEANELVTVRSVAELSPEQHAIVDTLAPKHRLVCMLYLRGVVEDLLVQHAVDFVDTALSRISKRTHD